MPGPFVDRFRTIVEPLFGSTFSTADGISEAELDDILSRTGYEIPEALQDFYTVVGTFDPVMEPHHRIYSPGNFSRIGGKRVFCEENQVVMYWAYDEDQGWRTDPPVYQGVNNDEIEWYIENDRCSEFLAGMIYWQALFGGLPKFRSAEVSESVRQAAGMWPLVYKDEDSQLFSRGALVFSLTDREKSIEIQAAALSEDDLDGLWQNLGLRVNWDQE